MLKAHSCPANTSHGKTTPNFRRISFLIILLAQFVLAGPLLAGDDPSRAEPISDTELIQLLLSEIGALKARVAILEAEPKAAAPPVIADASEPASSSVVDTELPLPLPAPAAAPAPTLPEPPAAPKPSPAATADPDPQDGGHTMSIPGGPSLSFRGFLDFNLDLGTAANPLVYPVTAPPSAIHNGFQFGEFDLFLNSKLSTNLLFLSEIVFGADATNTWSIDIERAQLTYKPSQYLQLSGGRMHTAMGYYNTAFHHGTWFQTATGRPFMYFFEDSGGILPVHIVGLEAAGLIPKTGSFNAHWIFQVGNGESTLYLVTPGVNPVENFLAESNHKAFNVAAYIRPSWARGLQIGANFYDDRRVPVGFPHVNNYIPGLYLVYITPTWEFMNEFELQREHPLGSTITYNTPLGYTQISRKFGRVRPYFRFQEVNVPVNDPLYSSVGRYEGPSEGLRMDFTDFAALKVQYNRIYTRNPLPLNGVDAQVSFTF